MSTIIVISAITITPSIFLVQTSLFLSRRPPTRADATGADASAFRKGREKVVAAAVKVDGGKRWGGVGD